eukprot:gene10091-11943_t
MAEGSGFGSTGYEAVRRSCAEWQELLLKQDHVAQNASRIVKAGVQTAFKGDSGNLKLDPAALFERLPDSAKSGLGIEDAEAWCKYVVRVSGARGNARLQTVDYGLAEKLYGRIQHFFPKLMWMKDHNKSGGEHGKVKFWVLTGLNEGFRWIKYEETTRFAPHLDKPFVRNANEISLFTINLFLNQHEPVEEPSNILLGGATRFFGDFDAENEAALRDKADQDADNAAILSLKPETGTASVFRQTPGARILHDGEEVVTGVKYLLRTDVMYKAFDLEQEEALEAFTTREEQDLMRQLCAYVEAKAPKRVIAEVEERLGMQIRSTCDS